MVLSKNLDPYFPKPRMFKRTRMWSKPGIKAWLRIRDRKPGIGPQGWIKEYLRVESEMVQELQFINTKIFEIDLTYVHLDPRNADLPRKITVVLGAGKDAKKTVMNRYDLYVTPDFDCSLRKLQRFARIPLDQPIGFDLEMLPLDCILRRIK